MTELTTQQTAPRHERHPAGTASANGQRHDPPAAGHHRSAADTLTYAFYGAGALSALVGQVWAAASHVPFPPAVPMWARWLIVTPAVAVVEVGGAAMAARADLRRRLGERAYGYRILSAAVACFAVAFNWIGHDPGSWLAYWFGGFSALAYLVWLFHSGDRRRDALRGAHKLAQVAPAYGVLQWAREPRLTRQARNLAVEFGYGVHESLRQARRQARDDARRAALAKHVETRIRARHKDPVRAAIAATTYDLDALATAIEARADYAGWAAVIGADLAPEPLTEPDPPYVSDPAGQSIAPAALEPQSVGDHAATADPSRRDDAQPDDLRPHTADDPAEATADHGDTDQESPMDTAAAVARWRSQDPTLEPVDIAARIGKSARTVRRYWHGPATKPTTPTGGTDSTAVSGDANQAAVTPDRRA